MRGFVLSSFVSAHFGASRLKARTLDPSPASLSLLPTILLLRSLMKSVSSVLAGERLNAARCALDKICLAGTVYDVEATG